MKLSAKDRAKRRAERREKRSAFLTRCVDEFKKIGFIATFVFCVLVIACCMTLFAISVISPESTMTPSVALALQIISVTAFGIIGTAFGFYCRSTTQEKTSLNDNSIVKNADGTFTKLVAAVTSVASNVVANKPTGNSGENVG